MILDDTIVALASAPGAGAIAVIRVSGPDAIEITNPVFKAKNKVALTQQPTHTLQLGQIVDQERVIDESLVSVFHGKRSYTGEPTVEISCHGSPYIQQEIINLMLKQGCRMAKPGEFTMRAFLNGKMDLSQAEAVADLIASDNAASHQIAMQQMRGGFASELQQLRDELLNFASLIELELDFSEEDVEFADRAEFQRLVNRIQKVLNKLIDSFAVGNVLKNGIPVAIVGEPNVGKSTLLNALLNEDRAIVSDIAGTTRDTIEDEIAIGGVGFRFIDTAGIRETTDTIEGLGIQKTFQKIEQAQVVLYLFDVSKIKNDQLSIEQVKTEIEKIKNRFPGKPLLIIANKKDSLTKEEQTAYKKAITDLHLISAKEKLGVETVQNRLLDFVNTGALKSNDTIVTNSRHYEALLKAQEEINKVQEGMQMGLTGDLLAIDIRQALYHFGEITGQVSNDDILGNIFANFCIGK
ncbi:tRNA uridine-5-carboxymethylaminomethyl(34) synthesis GTPase MnmE [Mesonia sp. HuA40]|uniref:tRNA uridine-5-carboxymethylaminomethyl(34) synthesis GTPase MnmE n=1 Tax=Mesonia sp. HuA40 TaxID=2602761 RepID=UPI0011C882D0|nr:tRNA uridine-5-carboxymethylaminomethyl(34) synthesis GTPase MnmE [Mesonia sp. HuA40]TXK73809.1 tRNA uridine-5-carboxymethylaminomethyl(34) synthesis GTPase MnmE [Mesonia sp. HuA40]